MISKFNLEDSFEQEFKISEDLVEGFTKLSGDKNPLHVNDIIAIDKGFKSKVIQGNLQNCFISYFIGECLPVKDVMILYQDINFKKPLYLYDVLFLKVKIIGIFESVGLIEFNFKFINQLDEVISNGKIKIKLTI
jgi:3-hydroxybutyryl-CoA dehydratase